MIFLLVFFLISALFVISAVLSSKLMLLRVFLGGEVSSHLGQIFARNIFDVESDSADSRFGHLKCLLELLTCWRRLTIFVFLFYRIFDWANHGIFFLLGLGWVNAARLLRVLQNYLINYVCSFILSGFRYHSSKVLNRVRAGTSSSLTSNWIRTFFLLFYE